MNSVVQREWLEWISVHATLLQERVYSRNVLKAVDQAVGEVVSGVDPPLVARSVVVVVLDHSVCWQVPHLGVTLCRVIQALLHSEVCLSRFVFSIAHGSELGNGFVNGARAVCAGVASKCMVRTSALLVDLLPCTSHQLQLLP